ncbi:MAG: nucleoside deaminase [Gammaproteobacteria bacterium]|nr:nucleoside deaminase [Gammaproteobacteria bacterium]
MSDLDTTFLKKSIEIATLSVNQGGGPFGAIIVKDDTIISTGNNQVTINNDPTAHAEIIAIRNACQTLASFTLEGCILYSSCEPCPMCMSAIYWSRLDRVVFAATEKDAAKAGFDDANIARELALPYTSRSIKVEHVKCEGHDACFTAWQNKPDKTSY